jgi:hypothetical protein
MQATAKFYPAAPALLTLVLNYNLSSVLQFFRGDKMTTFAN